jgi:hypothetical protein
MRNFCTTFVVFWYLRMSFVIQRHPIQECCTFVIFVSASNLFRLINDVCGMLSHPLYGKILQRITKNKQSDIDNRIYFYHFLILTSFVWSDYLSKIRRSEDAFRTLKKAWRRRRQRAQKPRPEGQRRDCKSRSYRFCNQSRFLWRLHNLS